MYELLVRIVVGVSLLQLGLDISRTAECPSRGCLARVERASRQVLKIDWQPISVFPAEAKKFR